LTLGENQVDIWLIDVAGQEDEVEHYRRLLSPDEARRADRFYFEKHRRRFTKARAAMREILSRYVGLAPQELAFSCGPKGKPELSGVLEKSGIKFNLSHSHELAVLAVAHRLTVGVDIELINPEFATEDVAEHFFSANEVQCLRALPSAQRADAFFSCWTRKEAYIKGLGEGLSVPLDSFEVAFGPGITAALLAVRFDRGEETRWSMYDIEAAQGYKAAVVVEGKGHRLRHLQWPLARIIH
jgi:4'-phosphopantetheinyl transferase